MTENITTIAAPIATPCPKCGAEVGKACRQPNGESMGKKFHAARSAAPQPVEPGVVATPEPEAERPRATEAQADRMRDTSICVIINTARFTTRRTVDKAEVSVEATEAKKDEEVDQDAVHVAKDLLDSPALRAIATFDHYTKLWFKARSVPSPLLRSSAYMFSIDALADMYAYLEQRKVERVALMDAFIKDYPTLVKKAKEKLGPLFDESEYPRVSELRRMFRFTWQVVEIGTPDEKIRRVSQQIFEKEKAKAEEVWTSAVGQIEDALAAAFSGVVEHLGERLGDGQEKPKRLRESALKRVNDFLDAFAQRNVGGSDRLAVLVDKAKKVTSGVDIKALREDGGVRKAVATGFQEIKASLDKMMEDRPSRAAVALGDEEV
jgi:hypothetical protein